MKVIDFVLKNLDNNLKNSKYNKNLISSDFNRHLTLRKFRFR